MELEDEDGLPVGYAPAVVYGDRTSHDDIDTFELPIHDYVGPVTVRLKTAHLSQLLPKLEIYDADEVLIHAAAADADYYAVNFTTRSQIPANTRDTSFACKASPPTKWGSADMS